LTSMVLVPAVLSTMLCGVMLYLSRDQAIVVMSSSVARVYSTILGFVIVFRTSMAFGRFFEGIAHVQMLFSKWRDAFSSLMAFIECSLSVHAEKQDRDMVEELVISKARLLHWFSMVSALSVQELQKGEDDHSRLCIIKYPADRLKVPEQSADGSARPQSKRKGAGRMLQEGADRGSLFFGDMENMSFMAVPRVPGMDDPLGPSGVHGMNSVTMPQDGTHSEDSVNFQDIRAAKQTLANEATKQQRRRAICIIGELTPQEFNQLYNSEDHVLTIIKWIIREISYLAVTGKLLIPPPILSRTYQEVSNGMLAFSMAKIKIATVPFPFPFAQVLSFALYAFYILCPFIVLEIMDEPGETSLEQIGIPLLMNFLTCAGYGAVNEIAIELEEPFGFDANDYPVHCQQTMIVRAMEDTYFARAPEDFTMKHFIGMHEQDQRGASTLSGSPRTSEWHRRASPLSPSEPSQSWA